MSQSSDEQSPFDKNLRSLLDAVAMFEREAGVVLDRLGLDTDAVRRVMDMLGSLSSEAVRPLAAALGIADVAAVEALARDVRALLQGEARLRREQAAAAARFDDFLKAVEALGAATAGLADLQARTQDRVEALAGKAAAMEETSARRQDLADEVARLRARIDELESTLQNELGVALGRSPDGDESATSSVRPAGTRRPAPRPVKASAGSHKILEGLPNLEPKVRPA
jgi:ABC-type transporter Mla subunit MlaD